MRYNLDKLLDLRFRLAEKGISYGSMPRSVSEAMNLLGDESLLSRPAKKRKRHKPQKSTIRIEEVSDGKL